MTGIDDVIETFDFMDDWEDRYRYIIDLGRELPPFTEADQTEDNRVHGCTSRVWLVHEMKDGKLVFKGESDAHIVRGLVAIILMILSGKDPQAVKETDVQAILGQLDLEKHLSPMRTNGLHAMVNKIKAIAETYAG